jgi:uncharacterized protein (UPF0216 family)
MEEGALRKLMGFELGRLHASLVVQPVPLDRLVLLQHPEAPTKDGGSHAFDPAVLQRLLASLPRDLPGRLRLPITVVEPSDLSDGYVEDRAAILALEALGVATTTPRDGKLWMGSSVWRRIAVDWPGCIQFLML